MPLYNSIAAVGAGPLSRLLDSLDAAAAQQHAGSILRALVILGLGAAGVYLMLPHGQPDDRRFQRYVGAALATLSLVFLVTVPISARFEAAVGQGTILWAVDNQPRFTNFTFYLFAFVSLASAVLMITSRNPVYSALWFALVLLGNSGLYFLQRADFLSTATIIVYAGAIVVTFLFVIMLAQPQGTARYDRHSREPLLVSATGLVLASVLVGTLHYSARFEPWEKRTDSPHRPAVASIAAAADQYEQQPRIGARHVAGLGKSLFVDHVASVEVIGVLLLAAVAGAVLIAGHQVERPGRRS
jgi:NADH-quinone oxidoreductase subunit J